MTNSNVAELNSSSVNLERRQPSSKIPTTTAGVPNIQRAINADQICILTFDRAGSSANIFDRATLDELNEHLAFVAAHPELKGLVLCSAKKSIFIAGADLHSISAETDPAKLRELIEFGQTVFNRIAALPLVTAAAIHGACVGGGFEIALACDWRVASTDKATRIGLPETQIGLIPAWGGSTRLARLISLPKALDVILAGKTVVGKQALKYGMIDALVPREYLFENALKKVYAGKPHRPSLCVEEQSFDRESAGGLVTSEAEPENARPLSCRAKGPRSRDARHQRFGGKNRCAWKWKASCTSRAAKQRAI